MSQGDVCHMEYSTTDLRASRTFYSTVFGWSFQDTPGMEDYALFSTPGGQQGGFSGGRNAEPPTDKGPIAHIEVSDIGATLVRINKAGGRTLTPKTKISGPFGFYALFLDNVGNRLGLWSPT
ncbi:MAG: VOC family protein [Candidatus Bipolaricaulota bacterium]|nr:VOC family protein [Candidatus Bipolaricaulota bacterium]